MHNRRKREESKKRESEEQTLEWKGGHSQGRNLDDELMGEGNF